MFRKSEIFLILNMDDLFREKLRQQIPLSVCFNHNVGWHGKQWKGPDYILNDDKEEEKDEMYFNECYETAINFIKDIFISQNKQKIKSYFVI